jgi:hypothetical protein
MLLFIVLLFPQLSPFGIMKGEWAALRHGKQVFLVERLCRCSVSYHDPALLKGSSRNAARVHLVLISLLHGQNSAPATAGLTYLVTFVDAAHVCASGYTLLKVFLVERFPFL